jgi:hypothetical protein
MAFYYDNRYGDIIYSDGCPIDPWSYVMQPGDQVYNVTVGELGQ